MCKPAFIALALFGAVCALYAPVAGHSFVDYDDYIYIVNNPNLPGGFTWAKVVAAFTLPYESNWIPLTWLSLQLDYELFGHDPSGYLLENVVLHGLSSVLLFFAFMRMSGALWCSAFVAAAFALHPLHVESVAWAAERKDTLSGLFFMATLLAWARYAREPRPTRYVTVLLLLTLGLLAKPSLVTLPFLLLLLDYWPLGRFRREGGAPGAIDPSRLRGPLLEKLPMLGIVAGVSTATFVVQQSLGAMALGELLPFEMRLMNALDSYVIYVGDSLWPTGLAVFYPHPVLSLSPMVSAAAALLLLVVSVGTLVSASARPYLAVGWLWYLGTLVPVIGLVQVGLQARADRYMYLPLIGLAVLCAWGAADLMGRHRRERRVLVIAAAAALAGMSLVSWLQIGYWRDTRTLFERAAAVTVKNYVAQRTLGDEFLRARDFEAARDQFLAFERSRPRSAVPKFRLGELFEEWGRLELAAVHFEAGLKIDPDDAKALTGMGVVRMRQEKLDEALVYYRKALALDASDASTHAGAAIASDGLGRVRDAVHYNREALRIDPELATAANNLAWLLATSGDHDLRDPVEATRLAESALQNSEDPEPEILDTLAAAYAADGRFREAVPIARRAAQLALERGQPQLGRQISEHADLYETGRALRL